jgi:aryl-alcohol dehydrogenase-like predicted oxidoreductase
MAVDLVQAPLNLVDRRLEVSGWLSRLKQMGVEVHTRSAFLQGLLLIPRDKIPARFERWAHLWNAWAHGREELGVSPVAACLGYPLYHPEVDCVVVGVDSLSQLTELIKEASWEPIPENWDFMAMEDERLLNPSRWSEL